MICSAADEHDAEEIREPFGSGPFAADRPRQPQHLLDAAALISGSCSRRRTRLTLGGCAQLEFMPLALELAADAGRDRAVRREHEGLPILRPAGQEFAAELLAADRSAPTAQGVLAVFVIAERYERRCLIHAGEGRAAPSPRRPTSWRCWSGRRIRFRAQARLAAPTGWPTTHAGPRHVQRI